MSMSEFILARQFEYSSNLAALVRIVIGRGADYPSTSLRRLGQQFVRTPIVGQAFLREAHSSMSTAHIIAPQPLQRVETAHLHSAVEFHVGPHPRRAVPDAVCQRDARPLIDVFLSKRGLDGGDARDGDGVAPSSGGQRSMMRVLSRWMWVSISPAQTKWPSAS